MEKSSNKTIYIIIGVVLLAVLIPAVLVVIFAAGFIFYASGAH
jgi:hypothetical protein